MAKTFTGLKLQGKIGKLAKLIKWCLVICWVSSGKVLSGSEHGNILIWENDLIKFVAKPDEHTSCHQDNIIYVDIYTTENHNHNENERERNDINFAGSDGHIRFWEWWYWIFEPSDDLPFFPLSLKHEIKVGASSKCKLMWWLTWK